MRRCIRCSKVLGDKHFHVGQDTCKKCRQRIERDRYRRDPLYSLWRTKKNYCKVHNIEFDLTVDYLRGLFDGRCAISGLTIEFGEDVENKATLDRINSDKGYTIGNVQFVIARMNRLKSDATEEELRMILENMIKNKETMVVDKNKVEVDNRTFEELMQIISEHETKEQKQFCWLLDEELAEYWDAIRDSNYFLPDINYFRPDPFGELPDEYYEEDACYELLAEIEENKKGGY